MVSSSYMDSAFSIIVMNDNKLNKNIFKSDFTSKNQFHLEIFITMERDGWHGHLLECAENNVNSYFTRKS